MKEMSIYNKLHRLFILLLSFLLFSCSDILLQPDSKPTSLEITPQRVVTIAGEDFNFSITFLDEAGQPITDTPAWADTSFTISDGSILEVRNNNIVAVKPGEAVFGVKIAGIYEDTEIRVTPRMYLTQSVQRLDGSIPIIAGRDAILRLFLQGEQRELASEQLSIRLFNNGNQFQTLTIPAGTARRYPLSDNVSSVNLPIPGELIQPGLSITVEAANGAIFPKDGAVFSFPIQQVPDFHLRFVPIRIAATGATGSINSSNTDEYLEELLDMFPIAQYETDLHAPLTVNASPANDNFYNAVLTQVEALRVAEGSPDYYYYGVIPQQTLGVVGLGYVGGRSAVGWDRAPAAYKTLAHELGHNFGRYHAPCGSVGSSDFNYPYADADIGVFGLEVDEIEVKNPNFYKDLMSYCTPSWISDYTYTGVLEYRNSLKNNSTDRNQPQDVLLVWGSMNNGEIILNPAFRIKAVPKLPTSPGSYTLSGYDENGTRLFSISFSGTKVSHGGRSFAFAIPVGRVQIEKLAALELNGRGKINKQKALGTAGLTGVSKNIPKVRAVSSGMNTVKLDWTSSDYKMTMVKNSRTGEILSFTNEGISNIHTDATELTLYFSDGVHTTVKQVSVQ